MTNDVRRCLHCHTHNPADREACRICDNTLAGAPEVVPETPRRTEPIDDPPVRQEIRHPAGQQGAYSARGPANPQVPTPAPPRARSTPRPGTLLIAPPPPPPVAPHPVRPAAGGAGRFIAAAIGFLLLIGFCLWYFRQSPDSGAEAGPDTAESSTAQAQAEMPCPPAAARWLPGGGRGAVLAAAFESERHVITLCRMPDGGLFYDGQLKGELVTADTHLSVPARKTGSGYLAQNGSYRYEVRDGLVVVTRNGVELTRLQVIQRP
ncbi:MULTISPECIES: hypothetical protein [unclassified Crossiella]|uniref:hypothetical protein n=1 Tax=unclassified Crossiella TaxID=2620835 RepID=UPI001FFF1A22|nr:MULTISPECIES: hypothetical protein [unclassified Crossiella]MCK2243805.1 hypothetical protein [Crossiella sp. S99.2]MCK2257664.1 hypothetical protein [Crossiella sp. S99.1]